MGPYGGAETIVSRRCRTAPHLCHENLLVLNLLSYSLETFGEKCHDMHAMNEHRKEMHQ